MSEQFSIVNLVLGIIGTITGIIALFISYWTFRKESPHLETKLLKCEHDFAISKSQAKTISFWTEFQIKNLGDRGTTVNDIGLTFVDDGKEYNFKKQYYRGRYGTGETQRKWINAHETMSVEADFFEPYEGNERDQIECTFTLYHTHGAEHVESISHKKREA
jgi:hypothetical protein